MSPTQKVDFFIAGVQKGGTTALHGYLMQHPTIQMAQVKEVHFFDDDGVDWVDPNYARLHGSFDWGDLKVTRGEATPIYVYWPNSLERIARYNPAAKLIVLLRHPSYRAYSHWKMETKRGLDTLSFVEAINRAGRARVADAPHGVHRVFSYVERSFYSAQLYRLLSLFPREQILFIRTDQLWHDLTLNLVRIQTFLDVGVQIQPQRSYVVPVLTWSQEGMSVEARNQLDALFSDDILLTASLAKLDLTDWLSPTYKETITPDQF